MAETIDEKLFASDVETAKAIAKDAMDAWNQNREQWSSYRNAAISTAVRVILRSKISADHQQLMIETFIAELDLLKFDRDRTQAPKSFWQRILSL